MAGTAGQALKDRIHGESLPTIGLRALANAALGRVTIFGLRAVNGGKVSPVIDDAFELVIGKSASSVITCLSL